MENIKQYKSFINSHYLSDGIRISVGIAIPAFVFGWFNLLPVGITFSLGAMCVSTTDIPGPMQYRRNGMFLCMGLIFMVSILTALAAANPILKGIEIGLFCFLFSMIGVYGPRGVAIGFSALLIMILTIDSHTSGWHILYNALYIVAGGIWYTLLSLMLYSIRPYKLTQQALGDCIIATAACLRTRASFYNKETDIEKSYQQLLKQQVDLEQKQQLARELLFNSQTIVKGSTITGRTLVMIFTETVDLLEKIMSSYQDYKILHQYFDNNDILQKFQQVIYKLADELETIGIAVQSGRPSVETGELHEQAHKLKTEYGQFRETNRTAENFEAFISLRNILQNIEDLTNHLHILHLYTTYDKQYVSDLPQSMENEKFISRLDIEFKILKDNLTLKSSTFRHALRVSIATVAGYVISKFLHVGHSYWILLTIVVILKPTYSFTKKRNFERMLGTIAGALIGLAILFFIKDRNVLFGIMVLLMIGTYSFMRWKYLVGVILMTPYVLLLFHLLYNRNFKAIFSDRLIDTAVGSVMALLANSFLMPAWEKERIRDYMLEVIKSNTEYFTTVSAAFTGTPYTIIQYKFSRKNTFVALANLSDAFTRMMAEPKSQQTNIRDLYHFVVLNHMLTSHIATLSQCVMPFSKIYASSDFNIIINHIVQQLNEAMATLNDETTASPLPSLPTYPLQEHVDKLIMQRRNEIKQGDFITATRQTLSELKPVVDQLNFIYSIAGDMVKISSKVKYMQ